MPEWLVTLIAIPVGLAGAFGALALLLFGFVWLTGLFGRQTDHPTLGLVTKAWGDGWRGRRPCGSAFASAPVGFCILPGRDGPDPDALAAHDRLEGRWDAVDAVLRDRLAHEIRELGPEVTGEDAARAARAGDRDGLHRASEIEGIATEIDEETREIVLEVTLLHCWDPEHAYVLRLDREARPLAYGLGSAGLDPLPA